jgi:hypothetical protein
MDALLINGFIAFIGFGILVVAVLLIFSSAIIMQYMPNTRLAKWLDGIWIDPDEKPDDVFNPKVGDCIKPRNK